MKQVEHFDFPDSESVGSIEYDPQSRHLKVRFVKGTLYVYFDVPHDLFDRFKKADSAGRFVHRELVGKFKYKRLQ